MSLLGYIRVLKLGAVNFWRNRWLSLAAILILSLTLLIISIFLTANLIINETTDSVKEKIDIEVYFQDNVPEQDILSLSRTVEARGDVKEVKYISKEEALEIWQNRQKGEIRSFVSPEKNPLPRSLKIKTNSPENIKAVSEFLIKSGFGDGIRKISSEENQPIIDRIISISNFSKKIGLAVSIIFAIISLIVIFNTIQMSIYIRKDEIGIMRLVGANSFYIRIPFIIESILFGLGATLLVLGLLALGLRFLLPMIAGYFGNASIDLKELFYNNFWRILLGELILAIFISTTASLISMGRYLKV